MTLKYIFSFLIFACFVSEQSYSQDGVITDVLPPVVMDILPESEILPDVKMQLKTHPEKIVFTQLKLSKTQPNVDGFAKISPFVQNAQDIDKSAMVLSEYNRIANTFNVHDEKAQIVVQAQLKTDEYSSLQNIIVFDELDDKTFFKFKMYGENVGIVPEDVRKYSKLQLSKARAERMFQTIGGAQEVVAEFILKPVYADRKEPFIMNEDKFWMMFARVAEFRLWSDQDPEKAQLLWFHRSDWYSPEDKSNIGGLFVQE
jgi:hypothetical protein